MNKSQLSQQVEERYNIHPLEAQKITDIFFNSMNEELSNDGRVEIRGFGNLIVREYGSYVGRNPKSGESVEVPPKKMPFWKTGKDLLDRMNDE